MLKFIKIAPIIICILLFQKITLAQNDSTAYVLGNYDKLKSNVLEESRQILVYLPDDYFKSDDYYPVLYVVDGDWNYLISSAYVNVLSSINRIPKMIVVAVLNVDRLRDFLPTHVEQVQTSGGSDKFLEFLNKELIPYIDKKYRTKSDRVLYGASNSGLYVIYHLLKNPDSFKGYISGSPTVRHDDFFVNKMAKEKISKLNLVNKFLYISYGANEGDWMIDPIKGLEKILDEVSPNCLTWKVERFDDEGHVPPASLYKGLKFIYPKDEKH